MTSSSHSPSRIYLSLGQKSNSQAALKSDAAEGKGLWVLTAQVKHRKKIGRHLPQPFPPFFNLRKKEVGEDGKVSVVWGAKDLGVQ